MGIHNGSPIWILFAPLLEFVVLELKGHFWLLLAVWHALMSMGLVKATTKHPQLSTSVFLIGLRCVVSTEFGCGYFDVASLSQS
jgi:hypothetical protein